MITATVSGTISGTVSGTISNNSRILFLLLAAIAVLSFACGEESAVEGIEGEGITTVNSGSVTVTDSVSEALTISVPEGAKSMVMMVSGAGSSLIIADKIISPSGVVVYDFDEEDLLVNPNRTDATSGLYNILVPSNPAVLFESGDWQVKFYTQSSAPFDVEVNTVIKTAAAIDNKLDLNLYFVGLDGLDAETAKSDENFQAMLSAFGTHYAKAGISVGDVTYETVSGADGDRLGVIDSVDGESSELADLFKLSTGKGNRALNFFFVADLQSGDAGTSLLGRAGGTPGPPGVHGTYRSGVVVNMTDFFNTERADGPQITSTIMAHEAGHYLGLYHTTEKHGQALASSFIGRDPLADTPVCGDDQANGDDTLSADDCKDADGNNLMFWTDPVTQSPVLTANQSTIMKNNPLVR